MTDFYQRWHQDYWYMCIVKNNTFISCHLPFAKCSSSCVVDVNVFGYLLCLESFFVYCSISCVFYSILCHLRTYVTLWIVCSTVFYISHQLFVVRCFMSDCVSHQLCVVRNFISVFSCVFRGILFHRICCIISYSHCVTLYSLSSRDLYCDSIICLCFLLMLLYLQCLYLCVHHNCLYIHVCISF